MQLVLQKIKEKERLRFQEEAPGTRLANDHDQTRHKRICQFFDKVDFDPVEYMKNNTIQCKKYNYAVPENYGSTNVILRYNKE